MALCADRWGFAVVIGLLSAICVADILAMFVIPDRKSARLD
ncbi:hypothetical protein ACYSUO_40120 [Streptomyces sp. UC4497]